ncbi:sigma 54-interacting transcriptional regulator [Desulfocurvus sp. DL9XJH121]
MTRSLSALKLQALSEISATIHKALDLEQALEEMLRVLSRTLHMERGTITLQDPANGSLAIMAAHGLSPEERSRGVYHMDEGVTGRIFRTMRPLHVPDVDADPLFLDRTGARGTKAGERISYTGVPIVMNNEPIGVLSVDRLFSDDVSVEEDIEFLTVLATLVAQFIRLNEAVRQREERLKNENAALLYQVSKEGKGPYIVGKSPPMAEVERQAAKVAPTPATVLLLGESGTGKTLIARIIHELSDRRSGPFVKVNCTSLQESQLEKEIFGHENGSEASARPSRFEEAAGGTIFLDEVGELPPALQAKLLRVLQDRKFERPGSNRTISSDVRIIAATNHDLRELADQGRFRLDLYYRLNVFPIALPPLRNRKEDVQGLLNHFLHNASRAYGRDLYCTPQALDLLHQHDWPGNVRELENMVERLAIMSEDGRIGQRLIKLALAAEAAVSRNRRDESRAEEEAAGQHSQGKPTLREMERNEILLALSESNWIKRRAGEALGLTERQIGYRVRKYGLEERVLSERRRLRERR